MSWSRYGTVMRNNSSAVVAVQESLPPSSVTHQDPNNEAASPSTTLIDCRRRVVTLMPADHPDKPACLNALGCAFQSQFGTSRRHDDISKAVECHSQAVALTPDGHLDKPAWMNNLGVAYQSLFKTFGRHDDIDKALNYFSRAAAQTLNGHPAKPTWLYNLGVTYMLRFDAFGGHDNITEAVVQLSQAVALTPEGHLCRPTYLINLGNAHQLLFEMFGGHNNISRAIDCLSQAVALTTDSDPEKLSRLNNLGVNYWSMFEMFGHHDDISGAFDCFSQGVVLISDGDPDKPTWLNNLGNTYKSLFETFGRYEDLSRGIECLSQAKALAPESHPEQRSYLNNLGSAYQLLFRKFGRYEDICRALDYHGQAVARTLDSHPHKPGLLNNLGIAYELRFTMFGKRHDLSTAVDCLRQAVALTRDGNPIKPVCLANLGRAYRYIFETFRRHDDLSEAVDCLSKAVVLTPDTHPDKSAWLNNLGSAYQLLFETFRRHNDISRAIDCVSQAVALKDDDHPGKPAILNNLGNTYQLLFEAFGRHDDLSRAVDCLSQAVALTPDGHPDMPGWLNNLGNTYQLLFETYGIHEDSSRAVGCLSQAVKITPDGHSSKPIKLYNLGAALWSRAVKWRDDINRVVAYSTSVALTPAVICETIVNSFCAFREAALMSTGTPSTRLRASRMWVALSLVTHQCSLGAHTRCMQLLAEAVWLGGSVHDRFVCLENEAYQLVADAVSAAVTMHHYDAAVEWFEQGRCMIWTQLLELRMPLDELRDTHPEAANELQRLSLLLEHSPMSSSDQVTLDVAQRHRQAADQREQLIKDIRQLAGFDNFLQPPKAAQLASHVRTHAVVVVNLSHERCDALVLRPGAESVEHVPLPDFTYEQAATTRTELVPQLQDRHGERKPVFYPVKPTMPIDQVLALLWRGIAQPVLTHMGVSRVLPVDQLPHIVWCVAGPLSFLPIHAAGDYTTGRPDTVLHNLAVSSYVPNLGVLSRSAAPDPPFSGMLAVGVASANRDTTPLPEVGRELGCVQRKFAGLRCTRLDDASARSEIVLKETADHSWVHFACHASQHGSNPLESGFKLFGADLDLAAISRTRLPHADFAFLSACLTATGDDKVPDETVHLAAGLLMAGYRSVIASMWTIFDKHAPAVAEKVYEYMLEGGVLDSGRAARALHKAMGELRDVIGVDKYDGWVPYIHMGC